MSLQRGLVQVYTGDGKGKTTAALGLALRAAGQGLNVYIIQFMKGWAHYGELTALEHQPNIILRQFGRPDFVDKEKPKPIDIQLARKALRHAQEIVASERYDLVILDEVNVALDYGLIDLDEVIALIENKPRKVELVLTGRYAHPRLIELADLVTEMVEVKHPYRQGMEGRRGIEF